MANANSGGELLQLPLDQLLLDWNNPRLPAAMQDESRSQEDLALFINKHYDPLRIADSIARHEYFQSEPMIAVRHGDRYVVIEGNRRLTALRGLADAALREKFAAENKGWTRLPEPSLPERLPVVVVEDAAAVAPLLGFRHISGIEPWGPYAQARYIARLVDEGQTLDAVADLVGRDPTEVRAMYRDYDVLEQGEKEFNLDTSRARASFGVFSNAMGRRGIQSYIGASAPRYTNPENWPLPDSAKEPLGNLLRWVFGSARGEGRVLTDSRQLGDLAKVLANPRATAILRKTGSLADACDALADSGEQFSRAVAAALRELRKVAALDVEELGDPEARVRLETIRALVERIIDRLPSEES